MANTLTGYVRFFWAGVAKHRQTGAIVPSQRFLIAKMIAPIPETYRGQIIELGAGNGAITRALACKCPQARILACEINPTLARDNRQSLNDAGIDGRVEVIADSAENVLSKVGRRELEKPDYVISGIPLRNLSEAKAHALIYAISQTLRDDGMYIQFQHSSLDRKKITARFANTHTVTVLLNFPPALVYYARQ